VGKGTKGAYSSVVGDSHQSAGSAWQLTLTIAHSAAAFPQNGFIMLRGCWTISLREQSAVTERPFKMIKLKKARAGSIRIFPSEISTARAAIAFVESLDPETRAKMHWRVAASALNDAAGQASFDQAGRAMRHALATEGWLAD
jgi:hypothetical protein